MPIDFAAVYHYQYTSVHSLDKHKYCSCPNKQVDQVAVRVATNALLKNHSCSVFSYPSINCSFVRAVVLIITARYANFRGRTLGAGGVTVLFSGSYIVVVRKYLLWSKDEITEYVRKFPKCLSRMYLPSILLQRSEISCDDLLLLN